MQKYNPGKIEPKWQKHWDKKKYFEAEDFSKQEKYYILVEFPYPSGDGLHVGHLRSYTALDILARKRRMQGYNVLYPMGWDAFGLPAENYALKHGVHPKQSTEKNIKNFKRQCKMMGFSFDWSREVSTIDPDYYRWTQWIFLQLYKKDLAYQATMPINWCSSCKIGLANEEVVDGKCERCGEVAEKKEMKQWMLKITEYADRLIEDLDDVDYLEKIKIQQKNWIGKSIGYELEFSISNSQFSIKTFTTRADTLYGATYMVLSPEHELVEKLRKQIKNWDEVEKYIKTATSKSDLDRTSLEKEKTGVELKGITAINPATGKEIPIWVADYVLISYGTGAIMCVPAHDERDKEFAKKFKLPIIEVVDKQNKLINSEEFNGLDWEKAKQDIAKKVGGKETVNYKLRDWVFSRQHYWGEPIPIIHCEKCGTVPVPEKDLPVELPEIEKYEPTGTGESPLAAVEDWVNVKCPECGADAKRETDTMPNWAGSNWYFLRYTDAKNDKAFAAAKKLKYWTPVDWYNGGMEHTTLHLLYSRFWHKFLYDQKVVPTKEPYQKRTSHGMILASDNQKMSKSRGNVVVPDDIVKQYGADVVRVYEMFMGPFDQAAAWDPKSIEGVNRFLNRVWALGDRIADKKIDNDGADIVVLLNQSIKKVTEDIESMDYNTAVSQMMVLTNELFKQESISKEVFEKFILVLSPFAPHLAEELWEKIGNKEAICKQQCPEYDKNKIQEQEIELVVQVNGKVRDKIKVAVDISEADAQKSALASEKVQKFLENKKPKKVIYVKGRLISIVV